ncbi:MAG: sulfatase-like hydrolase/transferase, partial [Anaerolineae bacterium]|nr:sulfatase-like hydrolase/transferase [Anaerolineae bacterium]
LAEAAGGEPVRTPAFDRLAAQGTRFSDAYCQMPLCTPSRLCQLTGQEVRACGAWTNQAVLRPELATIPKALAEAGYATCLVGKMHLGGNQQFVGFQHRPYGDLTGKTGHQWEPLSRDAHQSMRARTAHVGVTAIPESLIQDEVVAQETVAWLREHAHAHPNQPWFLCASFSRPHFPLTAPRRHFDRYWPEGVTLPKVPAGGDAYDHPMSVGMRGGFKVDAIDHAETVRARAAYFANVSYLDEVIGDLLLRLDAGGLLDNTIIVYSTDHGEMAGEHGVWWKNGWYEACTRVPLIVSTPAQRQGTSPARVVRTPVGLIDLFPTFCGFAGAEAPSDLPGVDLGAAIEGEDTFPDRPIFCDALTPRWGAGTEFRMIRWRDYKYVAFRDAPPLFFDLAADPGEQHNLVDQRLTGEAGEALVYLAAVAADTMDFDLAERERLERDGDLREIYAQDLPRASGNLYLFPDGRLVNVDDVMLYEPTVLSDNPAEAFGDWPGDILDPKEA